MDEPAQRSGKAALVRALDVPRNAKWGIGFGFTVAVAAFLWRISVGIQRPILLYVALLFVLGLSLAGLTTAVLTLFSAIRLAREV